MAIKLNPEEVTAYNNCGNEKVNLGDLKGAIDDFDYVIRLNSGCGPAYNNRATAKEELGDVEGAMADYDEAYV